MTTTRGIPAFTLDGRPLEVLAFTEQPHADGFQVVGYRQHMLAHGKPDNDGWPTEYWIQRAGRKFRLIENGWSDDDHESVHDGMWDAIKEANRRFRA